MKILILSDLHLEFAQLPLMPTQADVVVLAGDIWKNDNGIYWARSTWPDKELVYVAGNHEFYGREREYVLANLRAAAEETGVHFLDNTEVVIRGVRFLGTTLWTDFELFNKTNSSKEVIDDCMNCLADFRMIKEGDELFQPKHAIHLFQESAAWLRRKLIDEKFNGKTVVVTHHLPSIRSVAPPYINDLSSAGFASHLDDLLGYSELWIHGHTHTNFDYVANKTRIICNPRGYIVRGKPENLAFDSEMVVEI